MATPVIPKEQLTAYQRWELLGFDDASAPGRKRPGAGNADLAAHLPTAEDLERIQQQAAQEGFKLGKEEGYKAGYEAGRKAAGEIAGRLEGLIEALETEQMRQDEEISRELLDLALALSKQMVRTALKVKQGLVLEVIREALNVLPSMSGHTRIMVHPDDVETLHEFMGAEHVHFSYKVVPDSRLERGGFRIESSQGEVDGQLPVRWREIVDCLGSGSEWLE